MFFCFVGVKKMLKEDRLFPGFLKQWKKLVYRKRGESTII